MTGRMLASDQVVLLLSLVPYLREHGPTPLEDLARTFKVQPAMLKKLVTFLGTAGIPGETLAYQHNDLFDLDWDALELHDIVSLTHTVAIDETPRFTGAETAALLAGLHALTPMLSDADAKIAQELSQRVATAMNAKTEGAVSVSPSSPHEMLANLVQAIEMQRVVTFRYRDIAGTSSERTVHPYALIEREDVWYLHGFNVERDAERTFRVPQISKLALLGSFERTSDSASDPRASDDSGSRTKPAEPSERATQKTSEQESIELLANIPARLLTAIRGFAPTVVQAANLPDGIVQVSIASWHPGAAVRLAQHAPGSIEIIAPPAARAAVSEWAERALTAYSN